jgi:hypothetical protein
MTRSNKFEKIKPSSIGVDPRFQRDLDETRAKRLSKALNLSRIGHFVVSRRADGSMVVLDGQHRLTAMKMRGINEPIYCDVWDGLTLPEEAELFLWLNSDRRAVRVFDKFKARLIAQETSAIEIDGIVKKCGLRIGKAQSSKCVCAIKALEFAHVRHNNLPKTLEVLTRWSDGDPGVYDGKLIKDVSCFLAQFPEVNLSLLSKQLSPYSPERILNKINRAQGLRTDDGPRWEAACKVLLEIYNYKRRDKLRKSKAA